jgi:exopolysaccharide biosynthesis polyprenyl glycosylphosphotransferase
LVSGKAAFWTTVLIALGLHLSGAKTDVAVQGTVGFVSVVAFWISAAIRRTAGGCAASELSKNVLVVGTTRTARHIAEHLARAENGTRVVKGFIAGAQSGDPLVLGTVDDLPRIARAHFVDEVIVATGQDWQLCERAVAHALHQQLDVTVVPEICAKWPSRVSVKTAGTLPLITLHEEALPRLGLRFKRIFDIIASSTLLVCTAPLLLLIAILIKLESPGPVLYSASRLGRKGRKFTCYKFRSMYVDAERLKDALRDRNQREGPTFKISDDPRITPLGKVLRRYSLDELPQLWNVFNGSMSMVGPRPHPLDDCERYRLEDLRRLDVAPGITGLWQIKARQNPSFATNIALDLEYIENWNLGLDIGILLRTVSAVMRGTGA